MCGIAGFLSPPSANSATRAELAAIAARMAHALIHRGPDDEGTWTDPSAGVAFGFRRLAIVDLSPAGRQPMQSPSGRYTLVFNGEIYNHRQLRKELEAAASGIRFRGCSDTEVLLAAIEHWGFGEALLRCVGMFAMALWDNQKRELLLARDRVGEKPLYYGFAGSDFAFGSELSALQAHPQFSASVDRCALSLYTRYAYIPAPHAVFEDARKLVPGSILRITRADVESRRLPCPSEYWSANAMAEQALAHPFKGTEHEALESLDDLLRQSIRDQMLADVPLGAFLSGGIDSSLVVSLMQAQSSRPVKTFSIGFHEANYNEAGHARKVAAHLGTDHTELYVTPCEAQSVIPHLHSIYSEPFADSSQIPTYLISRLARQQVTVALSGDGGDELFSGYGRYEAVRRFWNSLGRLPAGTRKGLSNLIASIPPGLIESSLFWLAPALRYGAPSRVSAKLYRLSQALAEPTFAAVYQDVVSYWRRRDGIILQDSDPESSLADSVFCNGMSDLRQRMQFLDLVSYLPGDILVKVDRAAMATSLETRIPMLDHRVVDFAWRVPPALQVRDGQSKWLLRQLLSRHVPASLIDRPKMGFGVPIGSWLRGPLRDWAEDLLSYSALDECGYFAAAPIRRRWQEHLSGKRDWAQHLWIVLMFQSWLEAQQTVASTPCLAA